MADIARITRADSFADADFLTFNDNKENQCINSAPSDFKVKELKGLLKPEPLLVSDKTRFVLFPIKHNDVSKVEMHTYHNLILC